MLTAEQVARRAHEEFDDMVSETALSDYSVNEQDLGEIEINGKKKSYTSGSEMTIRYKHHQRRTLNPVKSESAI